MKESKCAETLLLPLMENSRFNSYGIQSVVLSTEPGVKTEEKGHNS